jgi:hypothetical protein
MIEEAWVLIKKIAAFGDNTARSLKIWRIKSW